MERLEPAWNIEPGDRASAPWLSPSGTAWSSSFAYDLSGNQASRIKERMQKMARSHWLRITAISLLAVGAVFAGSFWAIDRMNGGASTEQSRIGQTTSATDAGVQLTLSSAQFSATGSELQIIVDASKADLPHSAVGIAPDGLSIVGFQGTGFKQGWSIAGSTIHMTLPPVDPVASAHQVTIARLLLISTDGSRVSVRGRWELPIVVPKDIPKAFQTEDFRPRAIPVSGFELTVTGSRSRTETSIEYVLPADVMPLDAPSIRLASGEVFKATTNGSGPKVTAIFPETRFGEPIELQLGPFAGRNPADAVSIVIGIAGSPATDPGPGEYPAEVISAGGGGLSPVSLLLGGVERAIDRGGDGGRDRERTYLRFRLSGAWDPEFLGLRVQDARGQELQLRDVGVAYAVDAQGFSRPGSTAISAWYMADNDITSLRISTVASPRFIPASEFVPIQVQP